MTEFEKMRREEFYDFTSEECLASYYRAKHICAKLQTMTIEDADYRETIEDQIPGIPESSTVSPPFHCDHGLPWMVNCRTDDFHTAFLFLT